MRVYKYFDLLMVQDNKHKVIKTLDDKVVAKLPKSLMNGGLNNIKGHRIYYAIDGTLITLYHHNSQWHIATAHGVSVGNNCILGKTSLMSAFSEFCGVDKLKEGHTYSFLISHNDIHAPIDDHPHGLWLVETTDTSFEWQKQPLVDKLEPRAFTSGSYKWRGKPFFGYVCRHDDANVPDLIISSPLAHQLRTCFYNGIMDCGNPELRVLFSIIKAKMGACSTKLFETLFPRLKEKMKEVDDVLDNLVNRVIYYVRLNSSQIKKGNNELDRIAICISDDIDKSTKIDASDDVCKSIVRDLVCSQVYYPLVTEYFVKQAEE